MALAAKRGEIAGNSMSSTYSDCRSSSVAYWPNFVMRFVKRLKLNINPLKNPPCITNKLALISNKISEIRNHLSNKPAKVGAELKVLINTAKTMEKRII